MFSMNDWSQARKDIVTELGFGGVAAGMRVVEARITELERHDRYQVIARMEYDSERNGFTPAQLAAWSKFAETFGKDVIVDTNAISRPKTHDELALTVVRNEQSRIQSAKWQAEREAREAISE